MKNIRLRRNIIEYTNTKKIKKEKGITLIALVITIIVSYDKIMKCFNIKSFLRFGYRLRWVKTYLFLIS